MKILYILLRLLMGVLFIYAGAAKLMEPVVFAVLIDAYGIVPEPLLLPVAITLPAFEVGAGLCLIFDIRGSLASMVFLLILFIMVLSYGIWMGLDVDCGCFGPEDPEAKAFHGLRTTLYRDFALLAVVIFTYVLRRRLHIQPRSISIFLNNCNSNRRKKDADSYV